jgi:hypothetical protein
VKIYTVKSNGDESAANSNADGSTVKKGDQLESVGVEVRKQSTFL